MQAPTNKPVLTVSQLNRQSKELLETYLHQVQVTGEISNLARPASGHWYFTLKDSRAQIRCAMFRSRTQYVKFAPREGEQILVSGSISLYEARGDYQLIVDRMESAGEGALKLAFEQLKEKLGAEGLFDPSLKQPLPMPPKHLGVVTSPTGAAIKDILTVLKRRFPTLPVSIYPTQVQGELAGPQIAQAIERANRDQLCDVLIVGRGGGSLEDLWPFNEEIVARAIFNSRIPVISAVGHEVDFSISDMVADLRAPTPSAAAELVSPDRMEYLHRVNQLQRRLSTALQNRLGQHRFHLLQLVKRLRHPKDRLQEAMQRLDMAEQRMQQRMLLNLQQRQQRLQHLSHRLKQQSPERQLPQLSQHVRQLNQRLVLAMKQQLSELKHQLATQADVLNAVSPLSTLSRGYAIVSNDQGQAIKHANSVKVGDKLNARLHQGTLVCEVLESHDSDDTK